MRYPYIAISCSHDEKSRIARLATDRGETVSDFAGSILRREVDRLVAADELRARQRAGADEFMAPFYEARAQEPTP